MILIPKFKDIYAKNFPEISIQVKGEYRMVLHNGRGDVKLDTGWRPNIITDTGLDRLRRYNYVLSWDNNCVVGTDGTAASTSDTGIIGTVLGDDDGRSTESSSVAGSPNYERVSTYKYTFLPGTATGTIQEFILSDVTNGTGAGVRQVVSPSITKAAADYLDIFHRFTLYPYTGTATGTIDISGVSYDYSAHFLNLDDTAYVRRTMAHHQSNTATCARAATGTLDASVAGGLLTGTQDNGTTLISNNFGGTAGSYYCERTIRFGVDEANFDIRTYAFATALANNFTDGFGNIIPVGIEIGKTSDGTALTKENTHEFTVGLRITSGRYP